MMIESILLKKVASFDEKGILINDLKQINFIYGANGSGKTTLSNFLANGYKDEFIDSEIRWKYGQPLKCLVYNKKFREKNFSSGTIEGVFTLGQATKEQIEIIEKKQEALKKLNQEGLKIKETLEKQINKKETEEADFKESVWNQIYKKHEILFKEAFKGYMQKELLKNKFLSEYDNNTTSLMSVDLLKEKSRTIFGEAPVNIQPISTITFGRITEIESNAIWLKKIIGKSDAEIAGMIQKLNINDWVNQGKNYIQDDNNICPFCQQPTISEKFKKDLEDYFDESFTTSIKQIYSLSNEYIRLYQNLINSLSQIEDIEKNKKESFLKLETFSAYLKTLSSQFIFNKEFIDNKVKEPSRSMKLVDTEKQMQNIEEIISQANNEIKKHNNIVENYNAEKKELIQSIWKYLIEEHKIETEKYKRLTKGLQKGIDCLEKDLLNKRKEYSTLDNEIKKLNQNVTSIQPTIDQINNTLKSCGFENFNIVPSESVKNHYRIKRDDGTPAEMTLSEGEITFITFLYFMQLAKGSQDKDSITDERILVIDDPISSLDSNVLFIVSTLLKKIINEIKEGQGNIKQLILLTHNVYFHKEASFIDGRTNQNKHTHYWILRKKKKVSSIQAFKEKNPIQTSYELLWQELKNKDQNSGITIQNTMRRIIENYFRILGKYGDDELIDKFSSCEEKDICRSLICWINDGSHSVGDDLYIELQDDTIDSYMKVFREIFIRTDHKGHYDMMMGIQDTI
jgi:wobble nucleotide-excising tRNase